MSVVYSRSSRRIFALIFALLLATGAWLSLPAAGNQFLQRMLGGSRPRSRQAAPEEPTRSGPALVPTPLDVQGAPRLPRTMIQQSAQSSNGQSTLDQMVAQAIELTSRRYLDVQQEPPYTPWQIMHGVLALRENYVLRRGNQYIRATDYITSGPVFMGDCWFQRTSTGGRARPYNDVPYAFEGHINQFLALLSMSNLPLDHEIRVADGGTVTMQDMVNTAQSTANAREEITWTLWFLTHYTDQLSQWTNNEGEAWSIERMLRIQIDDAPYTAPCGGCHGLFALAYARNAYLVQHGELRGAWLEADQKVQRFISMAQTMQNGDGSFSSKYFKSRGAATDLDERIRTSGHMFEWLMMALPTSRLEEEWVRRGAARIATDLINSVNDDTELGGMYHACHSLVLYQQRMEQLRSRQQSPETQELADVPEQSVESQEPAPLSLPQNTTVAELPQRREVIEEQPVTNTPQQPTEVETEGDRLPLIVSDIDPEEPAPLPETTSEPRPEVVQRSTPPLILMPESPELQPEQPSPVVNVPPVPVTEEQTPTLRIPLLVTNEPATDESLPIESSTTDDSQDAPAATQDETTVEQNPTAIRPGLSFITPNRGNEEPTPIPAANDPSDEMAQEEPQTTEVVEAETTEPEPRVFTLDLPDTTGNHKPREATSAAPAQQGSRPVTGSTPATTPR